MLGPGVLGVRLDPVEVAFLLRALDLEARDERGQLVADDDHDRPLVREEVEARVVLDVRLVEEHDRHAGVLEQPRAALGELGRGDPGLLHGQGSIRRGARLSAGLACRSPGNGCRRRRSLAESVNSGDHPGVAQVEIDLGQGAAGELLERGAELARLSGYAQAVAEGGAGRVVLLGGEAGVGKTALVETLCAAHPELTLLRGQCEPLFAPPPLGPLLGVAEQALVDKGAPPHEIATTLLAKLGDRAVPCSSSRTCTGRTRRRSTSSSCSPVGSRASPAC